MTKQISINGMSCSGCELKIEKKLKSTEGIIKCKANYNTGTLNITFDENKIDLSKIKKIVDSLGYSTGSQQIKKDNINLFQLVYISLIIFGLYIIINHFGGFDIFNSFPQAKEGMGYTTLFIIGLLTSVHCIAMCGGINLSQCVNVKLSNSNKLDNLRPSFLYNLGRVISYTIIGGIVGGIGSVLSFSGAFKGIIAIFAGLFMIIMGLNMLNIFPWLRKFNIKMPKIFINKGTQKNNSPFYIGLLNGLMPCGPLQAMQLYALSTGNIIKGALSMFFFSIGTVALMFSFGVISSLLSKKFTTKMMSVSAVLVIVLGVSMFDTGITLSGFAFNINKNSVVENENITKEIQMVSIDITPRSYAPITVKKGVPVKWTIKADKKDINGCNNEIIIPKYNISKKLTPGENIIEFIPEEVGVIPYSCWMGMIKSKITVTE